MQPGDYRTFTEELKIVRREPDEAAVALLDVADRELRSRMPELAWPGFDAVRARLR